MHNCNDPLVIPRLSLSLLVRKWMWYIATQTCEILPYYLIFCFLFCHVYIKSHCQGVKLANNKIIIYPGGVTSVHLDNALSQTQFVRFWLHQSHHWHQHGELSLSETGGLRCKGLNSSNFTDDVWNQSHEYRNEVRKSLGFLLSGSPSIQK